MTETDGMGIMDIIEKAQEDIGKLLKALVQRSEIQIEDLNKQKLVVDNRCKKLTARQTELTSKITSLQKENNKLFEANERLADAKTDAKKEAYDLREQLRRILKRANGLTKDDSTDQLVSNSDIKLDFILVSDVEESKRANVILGDLNKNFPNINWELLLVPADKKRLGYADLIIYCTQLLKNHKDTAWVDNEAKKHDIQVIRLRGGSTQIILEVKKVIDNLSE